MDGRKMGKYTWYSNNHEVMSYFAALSMPPFFQNLIFDPVRRGYFVLGVVAPDRLFCDFSNHYRNITPTKSGRHYGKIHEKVEKETKLIREMLGNTDEVILHPKASSFFRGIIDTPVKAVVFELGVISHYVADAHQPFHTDGQLRYPNIKYDEIPIHRAYETDVRKNLGMLSSFYLSSDMRERKSRKITDVEKFILGIVKKHNKYYDKLFDVYYPLSKHNEKTRFKDVLSLTKVCFNNAVHDIRSVWNLFGDIEEKLSEGARLEKTINGIKSKLDKKNRYRIKVFKNGNVKIIIEK